MDNETIMMIIMLSFVNLLLLGSFTVFMHCSIETQDKYANISGFSELINELSILHEKIDSLGNEIRVLLTDDEEDMQRTEEMGSSISTREEVVNVTSNWAWDFNLAYQMEHLLENQSVADFGAGLACYGRYFLRNNSLYENSTMDDRCFFYDQSVISLMTNPQKVKSWKGYDGVYFVSEATGGLVQFLDFTKRVNLQEKFDWVISFESGEHILPVYEHAFIDNIANHARKGIIMSWSFPLGNGTESVNSRPENYVTNEMKRRGFALDYAWSSHLRRTTSLNRLKDSILVFKRPANLTAKI